MGGERRRHSLTCTGTTPAVTFPPTCPAHFAAGGEGSAGWQSGEGGQGKVWGYPALGWGDTQCVYRRQSSAVTPLLTLSGSQPSRYSAGNRMCFIPSPCTCLTPGSLHLHQLLHPSSLHGIPSGEPALISPHRAHRSQEQLRCALRPQQPLLISP